MYVLVCLQHSYSFLSHIRLFLEMYSQHTVNIFSCLNLYIILVVLTLLYT
jgi:hypothetical protein